jgi:Uma2 family endonuclease
MASAPIQRTLLSAEEYLILERGSGMKHELLDGEMIAMTGGSWAHGLIIGNMVTALNNRLEGGSCSVIPSDLRVRAAADFFTYPDVVVVCGPPEFDDCHQDTVLNPVVMVEVLSPSTESYDRGRKFEHYGMIDSLKEYVLITQGRPRVEHYLRQEGHVWTFTELSGLEAVLSLSSLGCEIPLSHLYKRIVFTS